MLQSPYNNKQVMATVLSHSMLEINEENSMESLGRFVLPTYTQFLFVYVYT